MSTHYSNTRISSKDHEASDIMEEKDYDIGYDSEQYDSDVDYLPSSMEIADIDEPYFMPPSLQLFATFACMMLCRRFDLFHPSVVKLIR